jgi:OmpA-OmpF porin, OOP family
MFKHRLTFSIAALLLLLVASVTAQTPTAQPEMTTLKSAFVPGDKILFYDDFSTMNPGDAPAFFKVRGGAPELQAAGDIRQLTITQRNTLIPNLATLPKNFTFEAELKFDKVVRSLVNVVLYSRNTQVFVMTMNVMPTEGEQQLQIKVPKYEDLGRKRVPANWSEPAKIALWAQNGRVRTFLNGEKLLDINQVELPPIDRVELDNSPNQSIGYRMVRFAESTPDFSQVIMSAGRYVTQGILFDVNSDRLKPESAPVIQSIAKGLEANSTLRVQIEGHTDSTGNAAANMDLSKRRAEAVKAVLATQFKIDAGRMTTAGLGASKPIASNDTPQGRAENRRVEFAKQ